MANAQNMGRIFAEIAQNASKISFRQENPRKTIGKANVGLSLETSSLLQGSKSDVNTI